MPVTINGTTGIATPDGSASVPPYTGSSGATNGLFFPSATSAAIATNGTNAVTIDSSQRVGIGTASPTALLNVKSSSDSAAIGVVAGASYAVRLGSGTGVGAFVEGVDVTGLASYQPLIVGGTQVSFTTSGTERARINTSGNLQFISADAGIVFNKTGALTNSTLNDYEVGTWTPTITAYSGSLTSYTSSGSYIKIGRSVTLTFLYVITNVGTATGVSQISNLPFAMAGANTSAGVMSENAVNGMGGTLVAASTTILYGKKYDNTTPFVANFGWICEYSYITNS